MTKGKCLRNIPVGISAYLASIYISEPICELNIPQSLRGICRYHTEPLVEPSWADFPLTLKLTPLGAFDLTSILAVVIQS